MPPGQPLPRPKTKEQLLKENRNRKLKSLLRKERRKEIVKNIKNLFN